LLFSPIDVGRRPSLKLPHVTVAASAIGASRTEPARFSFSPAWFHAPIGSVQKDHVAVIGITGGISTGKTSFGQCLHDLLPDAGFFDADVAARELGDKDPEVRGLIEKEFGAGVYSESGDLNRKQVRSIVFADADKKRALEQILHPRIRRQWSLEAERHRNSDKLFFADIPLLYETGGETLCDRVVVVACSPRVQLERLMKRASAMEGRAPARLGLSDAHASRHEDVPASQELRPPLDEITARQMIDAQMPLAEKIARADHVVWNNGGRDELREQARLLVELWESK
jgi:dephospho-CoA kinase